jgi:hypothetical protein
VGSLEGRSESVHHTWPTVQPLASQTGTHAVGRAAAADRAVLQDLPVQGPRFTALVARRSGARFLLYKR